jgi:glycosyltransferase 2 family protein
MLGFFMNNILPARSGEVVRAHLGSKVTGQTRTLVLATILSERLADGLTISMFFVVFAFGLSKAQSQWELLYVAIAFMFLSAAALAVIACKKPILSLADRILGNSQGTIKAYTLSRIHAFLEGLSPLYNLRKAPLIIVGSIIVWAIELGVYVAVSRAFVAELSLAYCVLFMVAVNFSSLIPAAPGGLGVIEAVASAVLVSIGLDKEKALTLVITQHAVQYLVVGIPGALLLLTWKKKFRNLYALSDGTEEASLDRC